MGCRRGRSKDVRPDPAGSLPSGRSAISLRCIGHARPGIRARKLIENSPAAAITLSWIQLLRRRVVLYLPGHVAVEGPPSLHPAPPSLPPPIHQRPETRPDGKEVVR